MLREVGYDEATIVRVRELLMKKGLKIDPEVQLFEDAICLVFLETQLDDFSRNHQEQKLVDILQKTWRKMSTKGHRAALELAAQLPERARRLVEQAVAS